MLTGDCFDMTHPRSVCPRVRCPEWVRCPECNLAAGYDVGRLDALRLVYVAAACAVVVCDWRVDDMCRREISACREIAVSNAYGDIAAATLETLAAYGCPVAREMLR